MHLAQQKIEYTEKMANIDIKINQIIKKLLSNNSKYSSISEFIDLNNLDESNIEKNDKILDSFDE